MREYIFTVLFFSFCKKGIYSTHTGGYSAILPQICIRRKRHYGVELLRTIRFAWDFTLSDQVFFPPFNLGPEWAWRQSGALTQVVQRLWTHKIFKKHLKNLQKLPGFSPDTLLWVSLLGQGLGWMNPEVPAHLNPSVTWAHLSMVNSSVVGVLNELI